MRILTIGFTRKCAETFFGKLRESGTRRVVDVRLNNVSQLAGFSRRQDLEYFLRELCDIGYVHLPELAPTRDMLDAYRKGREPWSVYESRFVDLMKQRAIERTLDPETLADGCLLCSEEKPHHCHRRLVAEYLSECWGGAEVAHLV